MTTLTPDEIAQLIESYANGPAELRRAVSGLSDSQLRTPAPPGHWSPLGVVCHIADFELVYADRLKRVVAEERPTLFGGDPDLFANKLAYDQRNVDEELAVIESVRRQVARFLKTLDPATFSRVGIHSDDGPLTLATLLKRISNHIPHHAEFLRQKRKTLGAPPV